LGFHRDIVQEEVSSSEREILYDQVERIIGILDPRNGDMPDLVNECRQDHFPEVHPELRFVLQTAFAVEKQIPGQASPVLAETNVERVLAHSIEPSPEAGEQIVEMAAILLVVEAASGLAKGVALIIAIGFKNESWLQKDL
jgi:hypothetical protein